VAGAGVGIGPKTLDHIDLLVAQEVDFVVLDAAHGQDRALIDLVSDTKNRHPKLQLIAGNVATALGAIQLVEAGADAVKVGVGPGSICTTREIAGIGEAQMTALRLAALSVRGEVPIIADGGIEQFGDINKALAAGADTVMMGSKFAGHAESPGSIETVKGQPMMRISGMGAVDTILEALEEGAEGRYFSTGDEEYAIVPEGISGLIPYKGEVHRTIVQLVGSLTKGMYYTGNVELGGLKHSRFVKVSNGAQLESHPHGVMIDKEAPNYTQR
jgi:IMP dehydrogenase